MFHDFPDEVSAVMTELEQRDEQDRGDGTAQIERLRQIPRETGQFLALLAAASPDGAWIEVGTSAGYSALWLSFACRVRSQQLVTYEFDGAKVQRAKKTFERAKVHDVVTLVEGDFLDHATEIRHVGFAFLDAEKDVYERCYELIVPQLVTGGMLVADNVISHAKDLATFVDRALADPRVDALVVPIGKGELVCRKR